MTHDKKPGVPSSGGLGIPMNIPVIGGGREQKVSMNEIIQGIMKNIHQLNTDYASFVNVINELSTRTALLESRTAALEGKQAVLPNKIEVIVKKEG